jgi:hypothetical protein
MSPLTDDDCNRGVTKRRDNRIGGGEHTRDDEENSGDHSGVLVCWFDE